MQIKGYKQGRNFTDKNNCHCTLVWYQKCDEKKTSSDSFQLHCSYNQGFLNSISHLFPTLKFLNLVLVSEHFWVQLCPYNYVWTFKLVNVSFPEQTGTILMGFEAQL